MATKYWYKAANGSDNWATATNWYLGSGGTGGTTTVPAATDDVIVDSNSGSGTLTIAAAATCLSLDLSSFTGTLAGTSTLSVVNALQFGLNMTLTYSGTITFPTSTGGYFYSNGKTISANVTINVGAANTFYFGDNTTFLSTATLTLTSGTLYSLGTLSLGLFVSTGAVSRYIIGSSVINITGVGTVWNVTGTLFGLDLGSGVNFRITNGSSSTKTITNTVTTAPAGSPPSGNPSWNFQPIMEITGSGTGSYTVTGNFWDLYFSNTGLPSVSFGTSTIYSSLNFLGSYVNWNNGATTITFNTDGSSITLSPNMTITASAALSITNPTSGNYVFIYCNGKYLTATVTINGNGGLSTVDTFYSTGAITVTLGTLSSSDVYVASISSSNSNLRYISIGDLYFLGTGTLLTTTISTNLNFYVNSISVINSSTSTKTLTLSSVVYPISAIFLGGSGSGAITYSPGAGTPQTFAVNVTNTGGAVVNISTATNIATLDFGTSSCVWTNTTTVTMTFWSLYLSPNMTITTCPTLLWNGSNQGEIRCYGKSITNLSVNDVTGGFNLFVTGDLYVSGTLTLTSGNMQLYNAVYGTTFSGMDKGFAGPTYSPGAYEDAYLGSFTSAAGSATRVFQTKNIYFTGTTAITSTSVTNLYFTCNNMYLTNSSGSARGISLNTTIYPTLAVYVAGIASGTTTVAASTVGSFDVIVTNTGACVISLSTGTIKSLIFATGSNAVWTNATTQTITIQNNLTIYSAGTPTLTPALVFNGLYSEVLTSTPTGNYYASYITLGGKSLVTGVVTVNDTTAVANSYIFVFADAFSSNAALTITSAAYVTFNGSVNATTFTSTSCNLATFNSTLSLTSTLTLANNAYNNSLTLNGTTSFASLVHSAIGTATFNGPVTTTGTINLSNATSPATLIHNNTVSALSVTLTNGTLTSNSTLNITNALTLTTGTIQVNGSNNYNIGYLSSSGTTVRTLSMGNGTWTLSGIPGSTASAYTIWNITATNLSFSAGASTINIIDSTSISNILFTGGTSLAYYTLQWNRGGSTASCSISSSNSYVNFIDIGTSAHNLLFTQGITHTIGNFVVNGSPGNLITLNSGNLTNGFTLLKSPVGLVNCDYLNIQHCIATPSNTWYAGTNSVNNQAVTTAGSGWIFTNMPPRKLGAGGVG